MPQSLQTFQKLTLLGSALLLNACDKQQNVVDVVAIGKPDPASMSPGSRTAVGYLLRGAVADGLVGLDEKGQVIPALADRWIVADDGMSYIFRLRAGKWPDGASITAASVQASLKLAMAATRGTPTAFDIASISEVRTMTGRVIELRLNRPQPDLLMLLAQPEFSLMRKSRGAGAMQMTRAGAVVSLTAIEPEKRGLPAIPNWSERIRKLNLQSLPATQAVQMYSDSRASVVLGGTAADIPVASTSAPIRRAMQFDPVQGLFGLSVLHSDGFLSQAANREAIAMAIDRDSLLAGLAAGQWSGRTRALPAGLVDTTAVTGGRWDEQPLAQRQATAAARVTKWRGSAATPMLRIAMPTGSGADLIFQKLANNLKKIGLETVRVGLAERAELRFIDTVASYPRAAWYFNQLSCSSQRGMCSAEADKLIVQAANEIDAAKQAQLLAEAEAELNDAYTFIPFGPPVRWSMVRSGTTGFTVNRLGYHPLMPLALLPK